MWDYPEGCWQQREKGVASTDCDKKLKRDQRATLCHNHQYQNTPSYRQKQRLGTQKRAAKREDLKQAGVVEEGWWGLQWGLILAQSYIMPTPILSLYTPYHTQALAGMLPLPAVGASATPPPPPVAAASSFSTAQPLPPPTHHDNQGLGPRPASITSSSTLLTLSFQQPSPPAVSVLDLVLNQLPQHL